MKSRRPAPAPNLRRIVIEFVALCALHFVLLQILARAHVLEHLLAPGPGSRLALAITAAFLLLRLFLLVFAPGWLLARVWLWMTRPTPCPTPPDRGCVPSAERKPPEI